ncbi:MAG: 50S ribosomal protein L28 [Elusimicrobiota bacterium]
MSYRCVVCDKGPSAGKSVSHSHRATNRIFKPNLQKIKVLWNNKKQRVYVCTACISAGKVKKTV